MPELTTFTPASWFALGYGVVLLLVAYGIDLMSHRASRTVEGHRTSGFVYHEEHDAWVCPEDQWLWPQSFDPDNRVMRYRGSPAVCNACPVRETCTTSKGGREVQRMVDPWPASESAKFHRGLACTVVVLAVLWPAMTALMVSSPTESWFLVTAAGLLALASWPLWSHLRRTAVDPDGVIFRSSDDNVEDRTLAAARDLARRSSYWSDTRSTRPPGPVDLPPPVRLPATYWSDTHPSKESTDSAGKRPR